MKKTLLMAALAAAVVGGALGCGGKGGADKAAVVPDTDTTFTDARDGKTYRKVEIGGQVWMAQNLNFAAEGSRCYKDGDEYCAKYGRLYNWETALKACPAGFHLPSDDEWTTLVDYAGGEKTAGTKLKTSTGWEENCLIKITCEKSEPVGTDEYGFSALAGGVGGFNGGFYNIGVNGVWWCATEYDSTYALYRFMGYYSESVYSNNEGVDRDYDIKPLLFSVRCIQNKEGEQ